MNVKEAYAIGLSAALEKVGLDWAGFGNAIGLGSNTGATGAKGLTAMANKAHKSTMATHIMRANPIKNVGSTFQNKLKNNAALGSTEAREAFSKSFRGD